MLGLGQSSEGLTPLIVVTEYLEKLRQEQAK